MASSIRNLQTNGFSLWKFSQLRFPVQAQVQKNKHETLPVKIFNSLRCEIKIIHATLNKTCERSKSEYLDDFRC